MKYLASFNILAYTLLSTLYGSKDLGPDQVTFTNGDHLHGTYLGLNNADTLSWQHTGAKATIEFSNENLHRILFNHGHPSSALSHNGYVKLTNGDLLPGNIETITSTNVALHTDYAGKLNIPRKFVSSITPQSGSETTIYKGPFTTGDWELIDEETDTFQQDDQIPLADHSWEFHSSAWFSTNKKGYLKKQDLILPDQYSITFDLYAKSYSGITLIFAADFKQPLEQNKKSTVSTINSITNNFGSCLLLRISGTSLTLSQYQFNRDGVPQQERLTSTASNRKMIQNQRSRVNVRVDRSKATIAVYLDQIFVSQWQLPKDDPILANNGLGFSSYSSRHLSRISDIIIKKWSGLLDDAISFNHDELDIVLMHNGTDRFSGKVSSINNNKLNLTGSYADYTIPLEEIKELTFAAKTLEPNLEPYAKEVSVRFYNLGHISGIPINTNHTVKDKLSLKSSILGNIEIKTEFLSELRFSDALFTLDTWTTER